MTIEEIKEWREQGGVAGFEKYGLIIIDTLLAEVGELTTDRRDCKQCASESAARIAELEAEVATLEKHNAISDQDVVELDQKLTIATEALEKQMRYYEDFNDAEMAMYETARAALERMKG